MINKDTLFTEEFTKISIQEILKDINEKGFFAFKSALTEETVKTIEKDATDNKFALNRNHVGGIFYETQYYFLNLLTTSEKFFNFCTSSFVFKICEGILGSKFRLKALRYYETYKGHRMKWHSDNKNDKGFQHIPGLIFIFYISDVTDGEFQYINGSHIWSGETQQSDHDDIFIENNYKESITSFKLPKGSLIIYNTYGIHRAKPIINKNYVRKSVFFQIDSKIENSEKILVNPKFLKEIDPQLSMYLGFGKENSYPHYPDTNLNILPISKPILIQVFKWIIYRIRKRIIMILPSGVKKILKKIF